MASDNKKKVYKKNFLTNVIFRIDFPKVLELSEKKTPTGLQKKISDSFPIVNEIKGGLVEYEVKPNSHFSVKSEDKTSWEFLSKDKNKKVIVDSDFLVLESLKYEHFDDFFKDIKLVFDTFLELYPVKLCKRTGLRYINQVKIETGSPLDWSNLIDENLFCVPSNFVTDKDNILKSMQLLEIKENENLLRFQFGFFNSEYPNPIARKEFVLDYDCFSTDEIETTEVFAKVKEFNQIIEKWFEKSILDDLRTIMGVENDK